MPPKVELRHLRKSFHTLHALDDVSLSVEAGEFITVLGPSGSGKSTLFNILAGLLEPDAGEILLDGLPLPHRTGQMGYMPQRDLLLPWRSVLDNVILSPELRGVPRPIAIAQAQKLLPLFGLEAFASAYPTALSGGLRQRAALLRTLLTEREVLLLDEPFGALDALTRRELQDWLLDLPGLGDEVHRTDPAGLKTILFITHDVEEALYLGDRVVVLSPRPGRVTLTHTVNLPRPRRRAMLAWPEFGAQEMLLLRALGVATEGERR